jgi:hypothetical protein
VGRGAGGGHGSPFGNSIREIHAGKCLCSLDFLANTVALLAGIFRHREHRGHREKTEGRNALIRVFSLLCALCVLCG